MAFFSGAAGLNPFVSRKRTFDGGSSAFNSGKRSALNMRAGIAEVVKDHYCKQDQQIESHGAGNSFDAQRGRVSMRVQGTPNFAIRGESENEVSDGCWVAGVKIGDKDIFNLFHCEPLVHIFSKNPYLNQLCSYNPGGDGLSGSIGIGAAIQHGNELPVESTLTNLRDGCDFVPAGYCLNPGNAHGMVDPELPPHDSMVASALRGTGTVCNNGGCHIQPLQKLYLCKKPWVFPRDGSCVPQIHIVQVPNQKLYPHVVAISAEDINEFLLRKEIQHKSLMDSVLYPSGSPGRAPSPKAIGAALDQIEQDMKDAFADDVTGFIHYGVLNMIQYALNCLTDPLHLAPNENAIQAVFSYAIKRLQLYYAYDIHRNYYTDDLYGTEELELYKKCPFNIGLDYSKVKAKDTHPNGSNPQKKQSWLSFIMCTLASAITQARGSIAKHMEQYYWCRSLSNSAPGEPVDGLW
jgi:hypothetical protein